MHPRNRYQRPHDFPALAKVVPELNEHFTQTPDGRLTLDFTHPTAVRLLNKALLIRDYDLKHWDLPPGSLCPGVPGRLDYIHLLADLIGETQNEIIGLDVGTGTSLIYPILGVKEYGWRFVATDVDATALKVAGAIAKFNPGLSKSIILRRQPDRSAIFPNVVLAEERFTFTMCNPPFYADADTAADAARKKWEKLGKETGDNLSFGGRANELWTEGGEPAFLRRMIRESGEFRERVGWFTTLVSRKGYLVLAHQELQRAGAREVRELPLGQGGKIRRVLAWRW
ncbi:MAG: 23S rRNA (adenine(1618)-N(6))-methyltransferase RlmF [Bacteroidota bacterium]